MYKNSTSKKKKKKKKKTLIIRRFRLLGVVVSWTGHYCVAMLTALAGRSRPAGAPLNRAARLAWRLTPMTNRRLRDT